MLMHKSLWLLSYALCECLVLPAAALSQFTKTDFLASFSIFPFHTYRDFDIVQYSLDTLCLLARTCVQIEAICSEMLLEILDCPLTPSVPPFVQGARSSGYV